MVARTAKRLESVQLFSSDRVCLKSVKLLCFIRVRVGYVWLFSSNIYLPRKHTVAYFERACQEGVHLHIFDRVRMLKPP